MQMKEFYLISAESCLSESILFLAVTKSQFKVTLKIPVTQADTCKPFVFSLLLEVTHFTYIFPPPTLILCKPLKWKNY